ncbi:LLM class flavin-dependent oxidoreductase [Mycolicibacterium conceptionense]|uniref:LLM class flavin-dependent oxidoreductase n=1 Tax=Mycolicibacterium conceptionense TaxID=451644 RepID=UPI00096F53A8|nr:LLM class flavin-dependent oxidoreductase [Mycolicibacterium conceptionense]OMB77232.1 luciferase [Mycolicibacterium conceptionense]
MKTLLMSTAAIPVTPEERRSRRPVARDVDLYQRMLGKYEATVRLADELGFDGFGSTEHHLQTEGGESMPNPLLAYAKLAAVTSRIQFMPMSVVVTSHDPIRVAEDIALFTHLFPGRLAGVQFARGYQTRWMQTLTQSDNIAALNPVSDQRNRDRFNEYVSIVEKAWAQDAFHHQGESYQVPFPADGIRDWALADWTRTYGSSDEVDADGTIRNVGVIPKPLHRPTIFVPNTFSPQTAIDSARNGRTVVVAAGSREQARKTAVLYRDTARDSGRELRVGENFGIVVKIAFGDTYAEAFDYAARTFGYWYQNYFQHFHFNEVFRTADDAPDRPLDLGDARALTQRMIECGHLLCGTAEQVRQQVADVATVYGDGELDWLVYETWGQALPDDERNDTHRHQLSTYADAIMPHFR